MLPGMRSWAWVLSALLCGSSGGAWGALPLQRPDAPRLSLAFEGGFSQTNAAPTRGAGLGVQLGLRFTDQLSITAAATGGAAEAGPFSTLGFGLQALFDSTPVAPFFDLQMVLLGPEATTGYALAVRMGFGADWKFAKAFAVGLAVRTLSPVDDFNNTAVAGTEIVLRFVLVPAWLP